MEVILALYVLSGIIKGYLQFFNVFTPIDITLLFAVMSFCAYLIECKGKNIYERVRYFQRPVILFLFFWIWMLFTLLYTTSTSYGYTKCLNFGTNLIPIYLILSKKNFNVKRFLQTFSLLLIPLTIIYLPFASMTYDSWDADLTEFSRMYLALGGGLGFVVLSIILSKKVVFSKNIDFFLSLSSFGLLVIIGARGPLLFTLLILGVHYLFRVKKRIIKFNPKRLFYFGLFFIPFFSYLIIKFNHILINIISFSYTRMLLLIEGVFSTGVKLGASANIRVEHYHDSLELIFLNVSNFIFGTGIGSYEIEVSGFDGRNHPHNQILEIWTELGLIGLVIYLVYFIFLIKNNSKFYVYISNLIIIYSVLNLLKSSSLVDIRIPLTFICLCVCQSNKLICNE